jgi:two-component sensor histidine kinase
MALLYQNMVEDKGVFNIHLGDFVEELMDEILDLYGLDRSAFAVETMLEEPDAIYGDRVIPFGLLMSEAARIFVEEGGAGGRLRIRLRRRDGALELEIASRERRLPRAYYDCGSDESLLLRVLAEQLKGELEFGDGSERGWTGTRIAIRIPA